MTPQLILEAPMSREFCASWTTIEEQATADAFGSDRRACEYLSWRAIVRRELGADCCIDYDPIGAPVVSNRDLHLAVSHCAGRIAVCISDRLCAVDVEPEGRNFERVASRYITPEERGLSNDALFAGVVWCAKEALYKYARRRELDFLTDLRIEAVDLPAGGVGTLRGRIENGEPIELSVLRSEGFIAVYIL